MLAATTRATMNFPFSYPYDDESSFQSMYDPLSMTMSTSMEATSSVPLPIQHHQDSNKRRQRRSDNTANVFPSPCDVQSQHPSSSSSSSSFPSACPLDTYRSEPSRWRALVARDTHATDAFVYAVVTTKIYCRPDCPARLARRANVRFFDLAAQAERGGFRACKRCKPNRVKASVFGGGGEVVSLSTSSSSAPSSAPSPRSEGTPNSSSAAESLSGPRTVSPVLLPAPDQQGQEQEREQHSHAAVDGHDDENENENENEDIHAKIQRAVHLVRQAALEKAQPLSLAQLSAQVGLSKWHLQRVFKKIQGVTPREMAEQILEAKATTTTTAATTTPVTIMLNVEGMPTSHPHTDPHVQGPQPLAPLPVRDLAAEGWFDGLLDSDNLFDCDYDHDFEYNDLRPQRQTQPQPQQWQWEGPEPHATLPSHPPPAVQFAHGVPTSMLPGPVPVDMNFDMAMSMDSDMGMDMDIDMHASDAAEIEGLLNDLFPEILV
ncbi:hypothetical protein AYO21_05132 [Fonsecaea monophora]|uniref:HTH araC/xylS-type domain-containing protein n=1 Tax=Fonsecaea monophora TaxID=254056 RepID=A0A177F9Y4_9EURO|nr:hypothetical protein AYO21_05132 [Fonsecaea monophora]KAH0832445.1 hypothetical protein FOPE_01162 [Fonsecaea pedrosoi]OAG40636.1 hypothetical protein AYO21_05132 [Fonsecaea monophora]